METTRQKKVARQIQKDVAEILLQKTSSILPGALISVSKVSNSNSHFLLFLFPDCMAVFEGLYIFAFFIKKKVVGAAGFEPAIYWSQTSRDTRLRYAPL